MIGIIYTVIMMFKIIKKEKLTCNYKESVIIALMSLLCIMICMCNSISKNDFTNVIYIISFSWLMILAYIDRISGYVYDVTEYYGVIIVIMVVLKIITENKYNSLMRLIALLICVLFYYFAGRRNVFGMGDADIFAVLSFVFEDFCINMIFYSVTCFLFIVRNTKELINNRGRLSNPKPLIPSIYMAYVLFIPFLL